MNTEKKMTGKVKKIALGAIVLFVLFIIICCMTDGGNDSEETMGNDSSTGSVEEVKGLVEEYCGMIKEFDLDNTGKFLASEPDYWVDMNENVLNTFMDIFKDGVSNLEYTIEDIEVDEGQEIFSWANVSVRFRFSDYSKVMSVALERLENELGDSWNEILIDFSLAKNRNKANPVWYIDTIPEDISIILTCNTESSFEKYSKESESNTTQEPDKEKTPETETHKNNDTRHKIGETVSFTADNGGKINVTLTDWGNRLDGIDGTVLYVDYTIENAGKESVKVGPGEFKIYVDDYSVETHYALTGAHYADLSAGRKMDGTFYAEINPENAAVIEVEYGDAVFVIKDGNLEAQNQESTQPSLGDESFNEGDYSFDVWTLAGAYEGEDVMPPTDMSISIYSSPEDDMVGNYTITIPSSGIEYKGELRRDSDKIFSLISNEDMYAVIEVIDETLGTITLHYVEDGFECNYRMYESYPKS